LNKLFRVTFLSQTYLTEDMKSKHGDIPAQLSAKSQKEAFFYHLLY
jgi:hypothetical protein